MRTVSRMGLVLLILLTIGAVNSALAVSTTIVISEFRARGPIGANDEFVELFNLSNSPVAIGGWKLRFSNPAGTKGDLATIPAGVVLGAGCHYLLTNSSTNQGPYSGSVPGDQTYGGGITDGSAGLAITMPNNFIVDQLGYGNGSGFFETALLPVLDNANLDRSYERKPGGISTSTQDTDNNYDDFVVISPSAPQNQACPCGKYPVGAGYANPGYVGVGTSTSLYVQVTPGTNPASTGLAVVIDLSSIGGAPSQQMFDNGTNGDAVSGDNTFSFKATVPFGTTEGDRYLPFVVSDQQSRATGGTSLATIHAVVPTRKTSWGAIKNIYR